MKKLRRFYDKQDWVKELKEVTSGLILIIIFIGIIIFNIVKYLSPPSPKYNHPFTDEPQVDLGRYSDLY